MNLIVPNSDPVDSRRGSPCPDNVLHWRLGSRLEVHVNVKLSTTTGFSVIVVNVLARRRDHMKVQVIPVIPHEANLNSPSLRPFSFQPLL